MTNEQLLQNSVEPEWLAKLNTKEGVQERFEDAKSFFESVHKLKLSNIELYNLRKIAEDVCAEVYKQEKSGLGQPSVDSLNIINPDQEIPSRFLQEYYGFTHDQAEKILGDVDEGLELINEFLRRKQEEFHKP